MPRTAPSWLLNSLLPLSSAAAFAFSGSFATSLFGAGWSPGAAALLRIAGAALVLATPTVIMLWSRWATVKTALPRIVLYGVVAMAMCQLFYFNAVQYLSVGVALLIEYLSPVLLILYSWVRTRRHPGVLTLLGALSAIVGLMLVLDIFDTHTIELTGVLWALAAAVCSATYFAMSAHSGPNVPLTLMAGGGLIAGAAVTALLGVSGLMPLNATTEPVVFAGTTMSWLVPALGLVLVSTVISYLLGIMAIRRLGTRVASFVSLIEVLFAVLWAWLLLDQLPRPLQLLGGVLIVAGVVSVRTGELRKNAATSAPCESGQENPAVEFSAEVLPSMQAPPVHGGDLRDDGCADAKN